MHLDDDYHLGAVSIKSSINYFILWTFLIIGSSLETALAVCNLLPIYKLNLNQERPYINE